MTERRQRREIGDTWVMPSYFAGPGSVIFTQHHWT